MKTAGIRELKARLSEYLREVQGGETVLVTDRGRVVAELRSPSPGNLAGTFESRLQRAVESGLIRPASVPQHERAARIHELIERAPRFELDASDVSRLLDEIRGEPAGE